MNNVDLAYDNDDRDDDDCDDDDANTEFLESDPRRCTAPHRHRHHRLHLHQSSGC